MASTGSSARNRGNLMVVMLTDSIAIAEDQVVVLPRQAHQIIHAINGILWITQEGNADDLLLHVGDQIALATGGMIAIQSLQAEFMLRITPTRRSLGSRLRAWLERMADEARENPDRLDLLAVAIASARRTRHECLQLHMSSSH